MSTIAQPVHHTPRRSTRKEKRIGYSVKIDAYLADCFHAIVPEHERADFFAEAIDRITRCTLSVCQQLAIISVELRNANAPREEGQDWPRSMIRIPLPKSLRSDCMKAWPELFRMYKHKAGVGCETAIIWMLNERFPIPLRSWYRQPAWFANAVHLDESGIVGRAAGSVPGTAMMLHLFSHAMNDREKRDRIMADMYYDALTCFADPLNGEITCEQRRAALEATDQMNDELDPADKAIALKLSKMTVARRRAVMGLADEYAENE